MRLAKKIGGRDPSTVRAWAVEERRFREFFRYSAVVVRSLWRRLTMISQVPYGGEPIHLLWTIRFMKVYPKKM